MDGSNWKWLAIVFMSIAEGLFVWIATWLIRTMRDEQTTLRQEAILLATRVGKLENTGVTWDDLKEVIKDTRQLLERMDEKLNRGSDTRHHIDSTSQAILNSVTAVLKDSKHTRDSIADLIETIKEKRS